MFVNGSLWHQTANPYLNLGFHKELPLAPYDDMYFSVGDAMCEHAESAKVFELANPSSVETCQPPH